MIAISLFIVLAVYVWIASTTSRFIARKMRSQTAGIITAIAFLLLPSWDSIWGAVQFRYLCAAEGGYKIVKTARSQGFFDADAQSGCEVTCVEALTEWGFRFVEMNVSKPLWLTRTKGLQRFYLTDSGAPSCAEFERYVSGHKGYISENVPRPKCVASETIASLSAQYDVAVANTQEAITWPTKIERLESYVRDRQTGEMLATGTSFRSWGGWLTRALPFGAASVCPLWKDSHGPIEHVLTAE